MKIMTHPTPNCFCRYATSISINILNLLSSNATEMPLRSNRCFERLKLTHQYENKIYHDQNLDIPMFYSSPKAFLLRKWIIQFLRTKKICHLWSLFFPLIFNIQCISKFFKMYPSPSTSYLPSSSVLVSSLFWIAVLASWLASLLSLLLPGILVSTQQPEWHLNCGSDHDCFYHALHNLAHG